MVNSNLRNKIQWNLKQNSSIFIHENAFEDVVCRMAAILSQSQCVKLSLCYVQRYVPLHLIILCLSPVAGEFVWHGRHLSVSMGIRVDPCTIPGWKINYIHYIVWDEITYLFPNFIGSTIDVWEWIRNSIPRFTPGMWLLMHAGIKVNPHW